MGHSYGNKPYNYLFQLNEAELKDLALDQKATEIPDNKD